MRETKITCDKCGLSIEPPDPNFKGNGNSLATLLYSGRLGHNRVPYEGWHFHYHCFDQVVNIIIGALENRG